MTERSNQYGVDPILIDCESYCCLIYLQSFIGTWRVIISMVFILTRMNTMRDNFCQYNEPNPTGQNHLSWKTTFKIYKSQINPVMLEAIFFWPVGECIWMHVFHTVLLVLEWKDAIGIHTKRYSVTTTSQIELTYLPWILCTWSICVLSVCFLDSTALHSLIGHFHSFSPVRHSKTASSSMIVSCKIRK